ncbi:MAG TPA: hypothetical protein VIJ34_02275 [Acidimicrobiales bacterium]
MENHQIHRFRGLLRDLRLDEASREFAAALGTDDSGRNDSLLVVGTPEFEPWHFVAHLADQARSAGRPDLMPTWIRWAAPAGARTHLSITMDRLAAVRRGDTVLVIAPNNASEHLLDRVSDARNQGARVLGLHRADRDLAGLADEALIVPTAAPPQTFEVVQHVVANTASGQTSRRIRRGRFA